MLNMIKRLFREEHGQGMAEYALILVLIAIAAFGAYKTLGARISEKVSEVVTGLDS